MDPLVEVGALVVSGRVTYSEACRLANGLVIPRSLNKKFTTVRNALLAPAGNQHHGQEVGEKKGVFRGGYTTEQVIPGSAVYPQGIACSLQLALFLGF